MPTKTDQNSTKVGPPADPPVTVPPGHVAAQPPAEDHELVLEDRLVEDVSIDGMCGVY